MLDHLRREIQTQLEDVLREADKLCRTLLSMAVGAFGAATANSDSRTAESADSEPMEDADSEPMESAGSEPMEDADSEPVESAGSEPMESADSEPIESADSEPVESAGSEPAVCEPAQRFALRSAHGPTGDVAASLPELAAHLQACDESVLLHHALSHDFSQWIAGVFHDGQRAAEVAADEAQLSADSPTADVERVRRLLLAALRG